MNHRFLPFKVLICPELRRMPSNYVKVHCLSANQNRVIFPSVFLNLVVGSTGCPRRKVLIRNFNSDLLITLIHSFLIYLDSADL